jgi:hypothetical protein
MLHHICREPKPDTTHVRVLITEHMRMSSYIQKTHTQPKIRTYQKQKMEIIPEINLRETFQSFVVGICSDCTRVLDEKRLPDTEANRRDIYENLVPLVVQNLVESPYFREFRDYVHVEPMGASGTLVEVKTDTGRICGWKCMDSTSERVVLHVQNGCMTYDQEEEPTSTSMSSSCIQCSGLL